MTSSPLRFAVLFLFLSFSTNANDAQAPTTFRGSERSRQSSADQAFGQFVDGYFDQYFHFRPARATEAGLHAYDDELQGYSRQQIEAEIARNHRALRELAGIPRASLSRSNRFDARLLEGSIRGHLLNLENIRMWAKDPNYYNGVVSEALFTLVKRNFAPVDERIKSLIARERHVPEVLENARLNVINPPEVYTRVAILQVAGEIGFLQHDLTKALVGAHDANLKDELAKVNQQAIDASSRYLDYLKNDLEPRSLGTFAIGEENYIKKLWYDEMVNTSIDRLIAIGEQALRKTQADFRATAAKIDPTKSPAQVLEELSRDHPDADHLLAQTQGTLDSLRRFVESHQILTIPPSPNPRAVETPRFERGLTFASMDTPGPYEEGSAEAFYNITPPEPDWTAAQKEQYLRFFSRYNIAITSIHEAYPGHYAQFLRLKSMTSKVRKLAGTLHEPWGEVGSNSEGWAHYCEQMMLDEGYGESDAKLRVAQLQQALMRLCRYLVGLRLHTRGMTLNEGIAFFEREGYMEHVNAEREAVRGTSDPTYLVYALGKLEILKLREDYRKQVGDKFNLKEFHDRFLDYGNPPVKMIRENMLGDDSPAL